jgi:GxxExxY protein
MELLHKELTGKIVESAITVRKSLGPGLLESAYEECLQYELITNGLSLLKQVPCLWFIKKKN